MLSGTQRHALQPPGAAKRSPMSGIGHELSACCGLCSWFGALRVETSNMLAEQALTLWEMCHVPE